MTYPKTPIAGYDIYSKFMPRMNEINDHCMSNIDIQLVELILMKYAEYGSTYHTLQIEEVINFTK